MSEFTIIDTQGSENVSYNTQIEAWSYNTKQE